MTGMPAYAGTAIAELTPGNDLESNPGLGQRLRFLAAPPEDEGVAALQDARRPCRRVPLRSCADRSPAAADRDAKRRHSCRRRRSPRAVAHGAGAGDRRDSRESRRRRRRCIRVRAASEAPDRPGLPRRGRRSRSPPQPLQDLTPAPLQEAPPPPPAPSFSAASPRPRRVARTSRTPEGSAMAAASSTISPATIA